MKIRIKFTKQGTMKFIGHLDLMRYFQKVMRKADVDIRYSEGFSPHQIMSFASPLGVGLTSLGEYVDIEVNSTDSSTAMLERINQAVVEGISVTEYKKLPDHAGNAMSLVAAADYTIAFREEYEPEDWSSLAVGLQDFLEQDEILVMKKTKKGEKEVNIRPMIYSLTVSGRQIQMQIATGSSANLKPDMVVRSYMEQNEKELAQFALLIERNEIYADLGSEGNRKLVSLAQLGEEIE
ncbi:MAG: TIGR03936 family radical SAM-associated protein [Lachnospiraceae bacterium]